MPPIILDLYGTSTDEETSSYEDSLLAIHDKFGNAVKFKFHYISWKREDGTFESVQAGRPEADADFLRHDIEENKRRLVLQEYSAEKFLEYLKVYNALKTRVPWQVLARYINLDSKMIEKEMASRGDYLLLEESKAIEELRKKYPSSAIPILLINGVLYTQSSDVLDISSEIAKLKLRKGAGYLSDDQTNVELFGGWLKIKNPNAYVYKGVYECYRDRNCGDKIDKEGVCAESGTLRQRCVYNVPPQVNLFLLADSSYNINQDQVLQNFKAENKGLAIQRIDRQSAEGKLKIKELRVKNFPAYFFDQSVEKSKLFDFYKQNKILLPQGNFYLFNTGKSNI